MQCEERWNTQQLITAVRQQLECLQRSGVQSLQAPTCIDVGAETTQSVQYEPIIQPEEPSPKPPLSKSVVAANSPLFELSPDKSADLSIEQREAALEILRKEVAVCMRCQELVQNRTQTVFGIGNIQPRLCFFGEAPGADEDRQGEPFVGRAGELLNKIIQACTLKREEVYILNVLKCRPPGNRNPLPDEVANCRRYFERQLELLKPDFICCLGAIAAQTLLRTTQAVGKLRGRFHDYRGSKVIVTYHPAYLLRAPEQKKATWQDMKMLMAEMGIERPQA